MDELSQIEKLNNNSKLFENEFENLSSFYNFNCENDVHDFIKLHPGIIILLNEFKPLLNQYFPLEI